MSVNLQGQTTGALPFFTNTNQNTSQNQTEATNGTSSGNNMNVYSDAQKAAQGTALNSLSSFLSGGGLPQGMGLSDAERQQGILDWNQNTAPILTAQNGAGTPALGSSLQQLILAMTAQGNQRAAGNLQGAAQGLGNLAFQAQGNQVQSQNAATGNTGVTGTLNNTQTGFDTSAALTWLGNVLGGPLQTNGGVPPTTTATTGQVVPQTT